MITWLASYPKSGNTWLRTLLTNYLHDGDAPADVNKLDGGPIASARMWFDEWVGIEASALTDEMIEQLRPGVYRCMVHENPQPLYIKVHDAWRCTASGDSVFPADISAGVVYILRNPLDVVASFANHFGLSLSDAVEKMCDPTHALARALGGLTDQLRQPMRDWSGHVQSWLDESGLPSHLVRYEDLLAEPEDIFGAVVQFCGLPVDPERIRKAVAFSSFDVLQRQEQENGFRERPLKAASPFFRRGQSGAWREELSPELVQRMIAFHGKTMRRFGCLDEHDQPL
ncbi:MAG: sulfotransferase domain-containing protein [Anaerolineales bacterium]|nr:sulfotransferase domain-containing protein [Anaerolineales bacterium]